MHFQDVRGDLARVGRGEHVGTEETLVAVAVEHGEIAQACGHLLECGS